MQVYFCIEKYSFVDQLEPANIELFRGIGAVQNNVLSVINIDIYLVKCRFL